MKKYLFLKHNVKSFKDDKKSVTFIKSRYYGNEKNTVKPKWIKIKIPADYSNIQKIKEVLRKNNLNSVCEEAACPNLTECFNKGTVTFMILGSICTRCCPFCNVDFGRPTIPDDNEPSRLAKTISDLSINHVVITSVNRDDLRDGGAQHFVNCISAIRNNNPNIKIEILVPDFRGCLNQALKIFNYALPDIFNHNIENVPRLYSKIRPGADYNRSMKLLKKFKEMYPKIPTKSGLMLGLGETSFENIEVMHDLRKQGVTMLTLGQYLQPSRYHLPVQRYISQDEFDNMKNKAIKMGFTHVYCGPFVRSSYHAELQVKENMLN